MNRECPNCQSSIPESAVNPDYGTATCPKCHSLFHVKIDKVETQPSTQNQSPLGQRKKTEVTIPENMAKAIDFDQMTITRKWFNWTAIILVPMAITWNGFMVVWFSIAFSQGELIMAAAGSIHALVGIGLIYTTIAKFINKTIISVTQNELVFKHAPLPWRKPKPVDKTEAKQFYAKKRVTHTKNGTSITYELRLQKNSGKDIKLIGGFSKPEQALYLEQEIENYWGIEDTNVSGELE